jgi:ATPase family associated with various cellular activities (AAA)
MSAPAWPEANQRTLVAALARVRAHLLRHAEAHPADGPADLSDAGEDGSASGPETGPAALEVVAECFALTPFERDLLLLCAGVELDASFAPLCAAAQGDARKAHPTFSLALAALPEAHWSALAPGGPLRRWRLVEVGAGETLTGAPLKIDERILHYLAGVWCQDERLRGLLQLIPPGAEPPPSHAALARRIAELWTGEGDWAGAPAVQLVGDDPAAARAVAAAAAGPAAQAWAPRAADLPRGAEAREGVARLWEREAALTGDALVLEWDDADDPETVRALAAFLEQPLGRVLVCGPQPLRTRQRLLLRLDLARPTTDEQRELWKGALGPLHAGLNGKLEGVVQQFRFGAQAIRAAGAAARAAAGRASGGDPGEGLWEACRAQSRPRLDDLAQRIEAGAGWDDLVLPPAQLQTLREIALQLRNRARVYEAWGFAGRGSRGLGITALFAGPSGTGKTMAGEVLARELRLDLYRVDLSAVVSKYIGETEKNLRRVFDAAEEGGAVLLFDEADALFGKRSEVKDSHDRYANIEVSYLLQRMEAYRGLAVLTTNARDALDTAFLRRLRFVVQFPFPDAAQRAEIWRRVFPAATPTAGLDHARLARLSVAGGNIRNIALGAAFLAADAGEPVGMAHLLRAARSEYAKLEKTLSEAETAGWT